MILIFIGNGCKKLMIKEIVINLFILEIVKV
jgi:hypothetical protein